MGLPSEAYVDPSGCLALLIYTLSTTKVPLTMLYMVQRGGGL